VIGFKTMQDLVSISAAAISLREHGDQISSQGLGKYCQKHNLIRGKGQGRGNPSLVILSEIISHRAANYTREVMSGSKIAPAAQSPANSPSAATASTSAPKSSPNPAKPVLVSTNHNPIIDETDPARRLKKAQAATAELKLQTEQGQLILIDEADAGIADAISVMRSAGQTSLKPWADRVVAQLGLPAARVREIKSLGKELLRSSQSTFADRASKITADSREEASMAHHRLRSLTALAHKLRLRPVRSSSSSPSA